MSFNTENRTILDLFSRQCRYVVPRYQRDYVWEERNWDELITDLEFITKIEDGIPWSHFLGAIVLSNHKHRSESDSIGGLRDFEIIDGQQRLTTIYFVLISIYRQFLIINTEESRGRAKYIYDTFITSLSDRSEKHIIIKNDDYEDDIARVIELAKDQGMPSKQNKFYSLFNYLQNTFNGITFEEMDSFLASLLNINVVEIISEQEEEIFNIFEVLNARGQKLKQMELLKNHIMKYIQPREDSFIDHAKDTWQEIINNGKELADIDDMLNHFTKCYIKKNAKNADLVYRLIKEEIEIDKLNKLLTDFHEFSTVYAIITNKDSDNKTIEYFNIKRNQQIRSLLTSIALLNKKEIISDEEKNKAFINIRNLFFIFNATRQTSNRTDKIVSSTSFELYNCETSIQFKYIISDFFNSMATYIDKKLFLSNFNSNQSFRYSNKDSKLKRNARLVKYTLREYCEYYQADTTLDTNRLTIEHLLNDNGYTDNSAIHNLTLTSEEINSRDLQDKSISEKIEILSNNSTIKINNELEDYLDGTELNQEKRKTDMANSLYDNIFNFDKEIFNITEDDISEFKNYQTMFKNHDELKKILLSTGKYFKIRLEKDPKLSELLRDYEEIVIDN